MDKLKIFLLNFNFKINYIIMSLSKENTRNLDILENERRQKEWNDKYGKDGQVKCHVNGCQTMICGPVQIFGKPRTTIGIVNTDLPTCMKHRGFA